MRRIFGDTRVKSPHTGTVGRNPLSNGNRAREWMRRARASALKAYGMSEFKNPLKR